MLSYIKHVIFDLDGVLVDSRDLHYYALNDALRTIDESYVNILLTSSTFSGNTTTIGISL